MDGWVDGWVDRWMDGWIDGWTDGWMDRWVGRWMDEWMDGWKDGWIWGGRWMDRWMNRQMAFGIQTVRNPDDLSGAEKSSHFMKIRINSSSLLLSSNTDFQRDLPSCSVYFFVICIWEVGKVRQSYSRLHAHSLFLSLTHTHPHLLGLG